MNKLILICLLFVIPTAFAATCANSALATKVGLDALTNSVTSTATLCPGLKSGDVCCSVDTINSFQVMINTGVTETVLEAAARDSYLIVARAAVSPLSSTFKTLQTTALAVAAKLKAGQADANTESAQKTVYKDFEEALEGGITTIYDMVEEGLAAEDNWSKYQAARATCANKVFEAQATVFCLACRVDPADYATFSNAGQLSYKGDYEEALAAACYPYLKTYAPAQNAISYPYAILENLSDLNTLVSSANTDITKLTSSSVTSLKSLVTKPTADYQETPVAATPCTTAKLCAYTYTTLLGDGVALVPEYLANGGSITVTASSSRLLGEARTLAAVFDPTSDDNASGVTVDFPADVIAAASAWRQGGLMTCVVALVAMLLF